MKALKFISAAAIACALASCGSINKISVMPQTKEITLYEYSGSPAVSFTNLDKPVGVRATYSELSAGNVNVNNFMNVLKTQYSYVPDVSVFARSAAENYMEKAGFEVSSSADYVLEISVNTFSFSSVGNKQVTYQVSLSYTLLNEAGEAVVPTNSANGYVTLPNTTLAGEGLGEAYFSALQKINWNRIAKLLTVQKSAKKEKNARVEGKGDTALEHTVIRWNVVSRPQGADVSWRVISSTPDVQNTNSNYVGTTPYETTETFDIKGLTYNNSGNVQIEVSCERSGYLTQKKRFNLRQAIDQKEISAMFNLIKDDE